MAKADQDRARTFFREVAQAKPSPMYLFHGEERYLLERAVEAIRTRLFGNEEVDPFLDVKLRAGEQSGQQVFDSARTVPMLGGTQLIVVRDCERWSDDELKWMLRYSESPSKRTCLVLVAAKIDGRKTVWKGLRERAYEVGFQPLYRDQMAGWLLSQGKSKGIELDGAAAEYLAEAVGTDMSLADVALEKLSLAGVKAVTLEIAKELVSDHRERSVFELTDALSARDLAGSLRALRSLAEHRAEPLQIAAMMARHVRLMMRVKSGHKRGLRDSALASFVGVSPYFLRDYVAAAGRFEIDELLAIHGQLYESDRLLKGSKRPGQLVLEQLATSFCGFRAEGRARR